MVIEIGSLLFSLQCPKETIEVTERSVTSHLVRLGMLYPFFSFYRQVNSAMAPIRPGIQAYLPPGHRAGCLQTPDHIQRLTSTPHVCFYTLTVAQYHYMSHDMHMVLSAVQITAHITTVTMTTTIRRGLLMIENASQMVVPVRIFGQST